MVDGTCEALTEEDHLLVAAVYDGEPRVEGGQVYRAFQEAWGLGIREEDGSI